MEREHVDATGAATLIAFTAGGETVPGATFFEFAPDGRVSGFTEFWPEPYAPPPGRDHLVVSIGTDPSRPSPGSSAVGSS